MHQFSWRTEKEIADRSEVLSFWKAELRKLRLATIHEEMSSLWPNPNNLKGENQETL
jgi:hypothetical protein